MAILKKLLYQLSFVLIITSCDQRNSDQPTPEDFGYLSMNISVSITEEPATGRVEAVSTDDWKVTIFNASDDTEVEVFDPFSLAPEEVQLPTGEYYIEAHSNNFQEAAFENPYYFGRSDNFTIDKEELKTIDIDAELANSKVAINYSPNVTSTFDSYSGTVSVVSSGTSLVYNETETREGYFVSEPLNVVVDLSYTKLDGSFITRQFTANIDAQPKTLYNINVDATLEDGKIVININVDETFEEEIIDLGDAVVGTPTFSMVIGEGGYDNAHWVIKTSDGGFLVGGNIGEPSYNPTQDDIFAIKFSQNGDLEWTFRLEENYRQESFDAFETDEGDFVIGGYQTGPGLRGYLVKISSSGAFIWNLVVPHTTQDLGFDISEANDGGILIAGRSGISSWWFGKIDLNANMLWNKLLTGVGVNQIESIIQTTDGGYAAAGVVSSAGGFFSQSFGGEDAWLIKFDQNRDIEWSTVIGGNGGDRFVDMVETSDGDFVLLGRTSSDTGMLTRVGGSDVFTAKVDSQGNIVWIETYGGSSSELAYRIIDNNDGTYTFCGGNGSNSLYGGYDAWIANISSNDGSLLNDYLHGGSGSDFASSVVRTDDGGYFVAGQSFSNDGEVGENNGNVDMWIYKVNEDGTF